MVSAKISYRFQIVIILNILLLFSIISTVGQPKERIQSNDDSKTIVFVGASNTEEGYRANESYVKRLKSFGDPWQNANLVNEGHAGWGMFSYFNKPDMIIEHVTRYEPNYVFIYLGGNDVVTGRRNKLNESYRYFLDTLYELDVNETIQEIFMINFNWGLWLLTTTSTILEEYNEDRILYQEIASDYSLLLLDFYEAFENRTEYFIEGDGHINDAGQRVIAEQIHLATAEIITPPMSTTQSTDSVMTNLTNSSSISPTQITSSIQTSSIQVPVLSENENIALNLPIIITTVVIVTIFRIKRKD